MKYIGLICLISLLHGCAWMERHPTATKIIAGSVLLSAGMRVTNNGKGRVETEPERTVTIPTPPSCPGVSCK